MQLIHQKSLLSPGKATGFHMEHTPVTASTTHSGIYILI